MNKILKIVCTLLIIVAVFFVLHFIITIDSVDKWITGLFKEEVPEQLTLVDIEHYDEEYGPHETERPCICFFEDKLYMVVGEVPVDITPNDINISYFGKITDFNDFIKYKRNCLVSEDGRYIVYMLYFKNTSYLYCLDVETQKFSFIDEKVDSFDIVENDGTDDLTVVYAKGYSEYNSLLVYTFSPVDSVVSHSDHTLVSENIKIAGVFESYGKVLYLNDNGMLFEYDIRIGRKSGVSTEVDKVYFPGDERFNYDDYYDSFTVCVSKNGTDYIVNGTSEAKIEQGYYNVIPKYTFKDDDGNKYYYSSHNKKIVACDDGNEKVLYNNLGNVYNVFGHYNHSTEGYGYFIAASADSLYMLRDDGSKAEKLIDLPSEYNENATILENHMKVYRLSDDAFLVNLLTSGSLVLNESKADSWLTKYDSYNYGLVSVKRNDGDFESTELSVPATRIMSQPAFVATREDSVENSSNIFYLSYFDDGSVKAISVLDKDGALLKADILVSAAFAKGQCDISVYPCETGTYVLRESKEEGMSFLLLPPDEVAFQVASGEKGAYTENYGEFSVAVSFGTLVIF